MQTYNIPVKYSVDEVLYTIRQVKSKMYSKPCSICEGSGKIYYKNKVMKCPECNGTGKINLNKNVYVVCDDVFKVITTKISINYNGDIYIKYKGQCGIPLITRAENNLFETRKEAQLKCDELNKEKIEIHIDDIIILDSFREKRPSIDKINKKLEYYKLYNGFEKDIVVNKDNVLVDGYINYLIYKMMNVEMVRVSVEDVEVKDNAV